MNNYDVIVLIMIFCEFVACSVFFDMRLLV